MTKNVFEILKERGLIESVSNEEVIKFFETPRKLYIGFDPTADSLHLGSLVGIVILKWFQMCGHTPIVLLGGATGRIGDPSGKSLERKLLDETTIKTNVRAIRGHFENILDFFHPTARAIVVNNDDWFSQFSFVDFLRDIGKLFRVGTMLGKESVRSRIESEEGISFTEFSYQIMQSYDFYHLFKNQGVALQMGGSDQWGNITAGIDLIRKLTGQPAYGVTFPLLTRSDGKKFGKTEEGTIWLSSDKLSPYDFYQYLYKVADADVIRLMQMLTFMDQDEIREYEIALNSSDMVPNKAQKRLAEELTRFIHGEEGLQSALKISEAASPGQETVLDAAVLSQMPNTELLRKEVVGQKFIELATLSGLTKSKGEASRLIAQGGAYLNNLKVEDPALQIQSDLLIEGQFLLLGSGKKKKILIKIKD